MTPAFIFLVLPVTLNSSYVACSSVLQYRTTVAKMLRRQADESRNAAQFIVTTFHPQVWSASVLCSLSMPSPL